MFIPPGDVIHESLATSYVLVDALVSDLCEGGFSGVVEVLLRDTDCFIAISNGVVAGVLEKQSAGSSIGSVPGGYSRTTVEGLSERSRLERGRVSIYGHPAAIANAIARRINAQPLYVGLSTEFTDLRKMISKLVREQDREWFVEINTQNGPAALIHILEGNCRIISSAGSTNSGALDLPGNPSLGYLIDECNRAGGTFDVYVTQQAAAQFGVIAEEAAPERTPVFLAEPVIVPEPHILNEEPIETEGVAAGPVSAAQIESPAVSDRDALAMALEDEGESGLEGGEQRELSSGLAAAVAATQSGFAATGESAAAVQPEESVERPTGDLSLVRDEFVPVAHDIDAMAEIKRLMGEIARAIDEAAQSVGRPDSFAMSLRAGQLEVAGRFPFLDPFAGDFEYLAGEIVFVGRAAGEDFIEGLTAALKLAIAAVSRSTAYPDRFRSYVREDLLKLHARERDEFERFGLDEVIRQLITF